MTGGLKLLVLMVVSDINLDHRALDQASCTHFTALDNQWTFISQEKPLNSVIDRLLLWT